MTKTMKITGNRIVSTLLCIAMLLSVVVSTTLSVSANSQFPYTIFATETVAINAPGFNLNGSGNIASNGTIIAPSFNQSNKLIENVGKNMTHIGEKIETTYFSGSNVDTYDGDFEQSDMNLNIANPIKVNGNLSLLGGNINPSSNLAIMAVGNINLLCETINANNNIIYSKKGDIEIEFPGSANLMGLIYAPHGDVTISAQGANLNGVVIIAENVTINSSANANINYSDSIGAFVGVDSESCEICDSVPESCHYGGTIAPPTSDGNGAIRIPNGNALAGNSGDNATRRVLDFNAQNLISGTAVALSDIYGLEIKTWGSNTENRQMFIQVNGVDSPMFHGSSTPHAERINAIMSHGEIAPRTEENILKYMNMYSGSPKVASNVVDVTPFAESGAFDVRIRANSDHVSFVEEVRLLDQNGDVLGYVLYDYDDGAWGRFVSGVSCGSCGECDESFENPDLIDIGEIYFKNIESIEDIYIDESGMKFVRNQLLLTAYNNVPYGEIGLLADEYNAEIVGFIELTNSFQLEITYNVSADEIYQIIDELMSNPLVEFASLNTIIESGYDSMPSNTSCCDGDYCELSDLLWIPNDPWRNDMYDDYEVCWGIDNLFYESEFGKIQHHRNWGLKAIDAPGAWEHIDKMSTVKVGLFDSMFQNQNDLKFAQIWNDNLSPSANLPSSNMHGNHVAGTMAAGFNNDVGISGVIPYSELYAVSRNGISASEEETIVIGTAMEHKYAFALLIGNNVKVINFSQNDLYEGVDSQNLIENANILGEFLNKLINMKYDFVFVTSAGNIKPLESPWAVENSYLNKIENIKERVIVVGSVGAAIENNEIIYNLSNFSKIGSRVDVVAPGESIYSTVNRNRYENSYIEFPNSTYNPLGIWYAWDGTSMAAPHVSGIAGLLYSLNPTLSGTQVKSIIVETAMESAVIDNRRVVQDGTNDDLHYYMANAKLAVEKALDTVGENDFLVPPHDIVFIGGEPYSTDLTVLDLSGLGLTSDDLDDLWRFTNLEELNLSGNQITNLLSLSGLINLERLNLSDNQIEDLNHLRNLKDLQNLNLEDNPIYLDDIEALQPYLPSNCEIIHNAPLRFITIKGVQYRTNLTSLNLNNSELTDDDITALAEMMNLRYLNLNGNQIGDVTSLQEVTSLELLNLSNNPLNLSQINVLQEALPGCEIFHNYCDCEVCAKCIALDNGGIYITVVEFLQKFWIAIYNLFSSTNNTRGMYLTDDDDELFKWSMPVIIIRSGDLILIAGTDNELESALKRGETNFDVELSEMIHLVDAAGNVKACWNPAPVCIICDL